MADAGAAAEGEEDDVAQRRRLAAEVLKLVREETDRLECEATLREQDESDQLQQLIAHEQVRGLIAQLHRGLQCVLSESVRGAAKGPLTPDRCPALHQASNEWDALIDSVTETIGPDDQGWVIEAVESFKLDRDLKEALAAPNDQNKKFWVKATNQIAKGWASLTLERISEKIVKYAEQKFELKKKRDDDNAMQMKQALQKIALELAALQLFRLSDHPLVSGAGGASWNVLEMHPDAWQHYSAALTFPNKKDAALLWRFLTASMSMDEVICTHEEAVLSRVIHTIEEEGGMFIALQEVSEGLLEKLEAVAAERRWGVFSGERMSAQDKCHAICVVVLSSSWVGIQLEHVLVTQNKKQRSYPLVQVGSTVIASVHVPHNKDPNAQDVMVLTALTVLKFVMDAVERLDGIDKVCIAGDLNAPSQIVCEKMYNELDGWVLKWFGTQEVAMLHGDIPVRVDVVLWLRRRRP